MYFKVLKLQYSNLKIQTKTRNPNVRMFENLCFEFRSFVLRICLSFAVWYLLFIQ